MIFKDGLVLLFLPLLFLFVYFLKKKNISASISFSCLELLQDYKPTFKLSLSKNLIYVRTATIAMILLALAKPQLPLKESPVQTEGIDIVLAVDSSGSMLAEDFRVDGKRQNRLEAVKKVVEDFIKMRENDRIGMVAFAARAYTVCPLTLDYDWLIENLRRVKIGAIENGTAVGSAVSSSLNRLKNSKAKSKIVILLTDGINNTGTISPLEAATIAKALGIKIYTIGAGTKDLAPYPVTDFFGQSVYQNIKIEIDEDTLKLIAQNTGGKYFRAVDTDSLKEIYAEIDSMEKTPFKEAGFQEHEELFQKFVIPALIFLAVEIILSNSILRSLP